MTIAQRPISQGLSISMPGDEMLFHITMYNGKDMMYKKSEVLKHVKSSYYLGMCDIYLAEQTVVDGRHIDIMRKLYQISMESKIKYWLNRVQEFKMAPVRSHSLCAELITAYEEVSQLPPDATEECKRLFKEAETEFKHLTSLRF